MPLKPIVTQPPPSKVLKLEDDACLGIDEQPVVPPAPTASLGVPPKFLLLSDLKSIEGYDEKRKFAKATLKYDEFVTGLKEVFKIFDPKTKKYDHSLIIWVCNTAEQYFVQEKKMGAIKEKAVIEVVKQYFNDDEELVKSIIKLVMPSIKKSNMFSRAVNKVVFFFLNLIAKR